MNGTKVISFVLEDKDVSRLDAYCTRHGYTSRSKAIRSIVLALVRYDDIPSEAKRLLKYMEEQNIFAKEEERQND